MHAGKGLGAVTGATVARSVMSLALALTAAAGAGSVPGAASPPLLGPNTLTEPHCFDPTQSNADFEAYGPTDVNAQTGNGRVTAGVNDRGTITVFKYPNPSYYNQVKYFAEKRDAAGRVQVQFPNEGAFAGIWYRTAAGTGFSWLRDWSTTQRYDSDDTPVPVTIHASPQSLGLTVAEIDMVPPLGLNAFERRFWVDRSANSPVQEARLVFYENFNPVGNRLPFLPITDWCLSQLSDQAAAYDSASQAIVHSWRGFDVAGARPASVAFAFGWDSPALEHQVGNDGYDPVSLRLVADGYDQARQAPFHLGGANSALGQVTGAISTGLSFDADGRAEGRLIIGAGPESAEASSMLAQARAKGFAATLASVTADWHSWLSSARLPRSDDPRVVMIAKRSLITARLAIAPDTGAIVASSDTQGPYGEDWIRDGSFVNELLDLNGHSADVTRHNLFYTRVQASPTNPDPTRPLGNWNMAYYADGVPGAPIPYEIDETGLGVWTLWRHASYLDPGGRAVYLRQVYPTITLAANYMAKVCVDPTNGFQCLAPEDDNYVPTQTLHGAETVYLGLQSAIAAAAAVGDHGANVGSWQARLTRLGTAIDSLYDGGQHAYREAPPSLQQPNPYNTDYGDGGWLLWPVAFHPYSDPRMAGEAIKVDSTMGLQTKPRGSYENKGLLGLAHAWHDNPTAAQRQDLLSTLSYTAANITTDTGHFGESWTRRFGPKPLPVQDQPHVWEHALFYLAAVTIDGDQPYVFSDTSFVAQNQGVHAAAGGVAGVTLPTTSRGDMRILLLGFLQGGGAPLVLVLGLVSLRFARPLLRPRRR